MALFQFFVADIGQTTMKSACGQINHFYDQPKPKFTYEFICILMALMKRY